MSQGHILITVSGPDRPGITAELMKILAGANHHLIDIGQAVTHGLLSLSILIGSSDETSKAIDEESHLDILKDLLFAAKKLGLRMDFEVIEEVAREAPQDKNKEAFILSCVSVKSIPSSFLFHLATLLAANEINILRIDNISQDSLKSLELTTSCNPQIEREEFKAALMELGDQYAIDLAFLKDNAYRRHKRLIVFDMDSTLIQTEVIDQLAKEKGCLEEVAKITQRAMNGEVDFDQSLTERVKLLAGLPEERLKVVLDRLELTPGAREFIFATKKIGYKLALISGGFSYFASALKEKLGLHYAFANELEIKNGFLTGGLKGTIINAQQKALILEMIAQQENIQLEQVVAIGDGANDLPMLAKAGLGIAYHAKDVVKKKASTSLGHGPMTSILYFLGLPGSHL